MTWGVACNRKRVDYGVCYHATARAIESGGTARLYPNGSPLQTSLKHSVSVERVDVLVWVVDPVRRTVMSPRAAFVYRGASFAAASRFSSISASSG